MPQPPRRGKVWAHGRPAPSLCSAWQNKQKSRLEFLRLFWISRFRVQCYQLSVSQSSWNDWNLAILTSSHSSRVRNKFQHKGGSMGANCRSRIVSFLLTPLLLACIALGMLSSSQFITCSQAFQGTLNESSSRLLCWDTDDLIIKTSYILVQLCWSFFSQSLVTLDWIFCGWRWSLTQLVEQEFHMWDYKCHSCAHRGAESRILYTHTWITVGSRCFIHPWSPAIISSLSSDFSGNMLNNILFDPHHIHFREDHSGFGIQDLPQKSSIKAKVRPLGLNQDFFGAIYGTF